MPNDTERRRWDDIETARAWPARGEPITDAVTPYLLRAAAPQPGEHVLDIGCGGGRTTAAAAALVRPGGSATGADISSAMVAMASERAAAMKARNLRFTVADMQVERAEGAPFHLAMSQFGVMFFEDPMAAFANIRLQLRRGGRFVFACWQAGEKNAWSSREVLTRFSSEPARAAPNGPGPFAFADSRRTRLLLAEAGFAEVERRALRAVARVPEAVLTDRSQLKSNRVAPEHEAAAIAALEAHAARFRVAAGVVRVELAFQLFSAKNR